MSHGLDSAAPIAQNMGWLGCVINVINRWVMRLGMLALLAASLILTDSVISRYFFKASSDWQDEAAIFCLVGATFLCGAFVQSRRGHIGIEAIADVLPDWVNRIRLLLVDIFSALFCLHFFNFCFKSALFACNPCPLFFKSIQQRFYKSFLGFVF